MKEIHAKCQGEEIAHALRDTRAPVQHGRFKIEITRGAWPLARPWVLGTDR